MMWRAIIFLLIWPTVTFGQGAATLVADSVTLNDQKQLIATGNIEVLYQGNRLTASQIIYDQPGDRLIITGPIVIRTSDGTVLTASQGDLDPQLENGMLQGARIVLNQQLQLAAAQIDRRDGRYSQLYKTVATSCQICGNRPALWDIRAERVVHDSVEQQLYFTNATFRVRGVPLLWLPQMRLPDPALARSSGFLIPKQRNTSQLGTGIKIPYFVTLGDYADITVTPYVSSETTTLELIYRQAFVNGNLTAEGAVSNDTLEDMQRSYIFVEGDFALRDDVQLRFDIEAVSDPAYLLDYGYSDKDRLDSAIDLLRVTETTLLHTRLTYYQTLRDDESNASLPPIVADARYETKLRPDFGGTVSLSTSIDTAYRYSNVDGDAGRDVSRAGGDVAWRHSWLLPGGLVGGIETGLRADIYDVADDSAFPGTDLRIVPRIGGTLRWPLGYQNPNGAMHLIEPTLSFGLSEAYGNTPPNEDSTRNDLGQGNLFDISRFAGEDAVETGLHGAFGASWTRIGANGTTSKLSFGRVVRDRVQDNFTRSSGLDGLRSDWLVGGQVVIAGGFLFDAFALIDDDRMLNRADGRIAWQNEDVSLAASYIWQTGDSAEDRPDTISEWTFDAGFDLSDAWTINLDARYNVAEDRPVRGGVGVEWRNECVSIDVSASRRFTSSDTVEPTTTYGLSGSLTGFSAGRAGRGLAASCRN